MTIGAYHARWRNGGRFVPPVAAMEIVSDSTVCFLPPWTTRHCPACGTVFRASVMDPLTTGGVAACPYCLCPSTVPLRRAGTHGPPDMPPPPAAAGAERARETYRAAREDTA